MNTSINKDSTISNNSVADIIFIQERLLFERRIRITIMSLLLGALLFTTIYGTLQDPFQYTFSKIGNRFDNRMLFIVWAIFTGFTIQTSVITLFKLEQYHLKIAYKSQPAKKKTGSY